MNHDVFISYSKNDATRIKPLRDALTAAGIKYWIDDRIDGSENFLAEIPDAIRKCSIVLFVASQSSANSEWTQKELLYARKLKKEIFPYKLDDFKFENCAELDFFFTNIQWKESVNDVIAGLEKKLGVRALELTSAPIPQSAPIPFKKYWWVAFVVLVSVIICFWVLEDITYAKMKNIPDNDFVVYNAGRKMGYMQKSTNSIIIQAKYDYAIDFSEGLARVELYGKSGFIDKSGNEVIHLKYAEARNFNEGLAAVKLNDKWGYIDKTGNEVISLKYDDAGSFSEDLAAVGLNGKNGFIDKTDKVVISLKYDDAKFFSEGLAAVKLNDKWGYIDKTDKMVIPLQYDDTRSFSEGLARVKLNGKYGYINKIGIAVIPLKYDFAGFFSEGLAYVELNGKEGYIDKTGKEVIPLKYDNVGYYFSEGLARVKLNGKWGFVDKSDRVVIPLKYDFVDNFSENKAKVTLNGEKFYIDNNGNRIE